MWSPPNNKDQLLYEITSYACQLILNSPNADDIIGSAQSGTLIEFVHQSQLSGKLKNRVPRLRIFRLPTSTSFYIVSALLFPSDSATDIDMAKGKVLHCLMYWLGLSVRLLIHGYMHHLVALFALLALFVRCFSKIHFQCLFHLNLGRLSYDIQCKCDWLTRASIV